MVTSNIRECLHGMTRTSAHVLGTAAKAHPGQHPPSPHPTHPLGTSWRPRCCLILESISHAWDSVSRVTCALREGISSISISAKPDFLSLHHSSLHHSFDLLLFHPTRLLINNVNTTLMVCFHPPFPHHHHLHQLTSITVWPSAAFIHLTNHHGHQCFGSDGRKVCMNVFFFFLHHHRHHHTSTAPRPAARLRVAITSA